MKTVIAVILIFFSLGNTAMATESEKVCQSQNLSELSKSDFKVLAKNAQDLMGTDFGWKVMKISEGIVDSWGFFGSYKDARSDVVQASYGMLNWKQVDAAMKASLRYSCRTYWQPH